MGGKAKFKKHTAKELQDKLNAQRNVGGGKAGSASRTSVKLNFTCEVCMSSSPDIKTLELHYAGKHPKVSFDKDAFMAKAEAARSAAMAAAPKATHHAGGRK